MYVFNEEEYNRRMAWYLNARFGMFIHWGLYAIPARGEWVRSTEEMPEGEYKPFAAQFNPTRFDAHEWAREAKQAGMEYVVLTAKHHDGFCLFDTKTTSWNVMNTPLGRDVVREFVDAVRQEGLKVGLYYSLLDWHHPDFPHYGDWHHPARDDEKQGNEGRDFSRYLDYMFEQVRELCTNYGKLDLLWFDFSYDTMRAEKWKASELVSLVRSLQPNVIINNRLEVSGEGFGSLAQGKPTSYHGDFITPERMIPPACIRDIKGKPLAWESCITMNDSWGYTRTDGHWKSSGLLIQKLVECVSKGGNLLLNVGPNAQGEFPKESQQRLEEIGRWMNSHAQSIKGCWQSSLNKPEYGRYTQTAREGKTVIYYHILEPSLTALPLAGIRRDSIERMRLLASGAEVKVSDSWTHSDYPQIAFADIEPLEVQGPDTVLEIVLKDEL